MILLGLMLEILYGLVNLCIYHFADQGAQLARYVVAKQDISFEFVVCKYYQALPVITIYDPIVLQTFAKELKPLFLALFLGLAEPWFWLSKIASWLEWLELFT